MIPPMSIESAYAACEQLCRQASSTFFASFAALPSEKRSAVHAVYAFCRRADDIADGDHLPESNPDAGLDAMVEARDEDLRSVHGVPPANPPEVHLRRLRALVDLRRSLRACLSDAPFQSNDPVMIALRDVLRRYPVRIEDLELIIDGMEDDLFPMRCSTLDDLRAYCYKVASAVGLVLIEIYGYEDGAARLHAIDMGIELQMINVLRDVKEDLNRDRVYLPHDLLSAHGIGMEDLASPDLAHEQPMDGFHRRVPDDRSQAQEIGAADASIARRSLPPPTQIDVRSLRIDPRLTGAQRLQHPRSGHPSVTLDQVPLGARDVDPQVPCRHPIGLNLPRAPRSGGG